MGFQVHGLKTRKRQIRPLLFNYTPRRLLLIGRHWLWYRFPDKFNVRIQIESRQQHSVNTRETLMLKVSIGLRRFDQKSLLRLSILVFRLKSRNISEIDRDSQNVSRLFGHSQTDLFLVEIFQTHPSSVENIERFLTWFDHSRAYFFPVQNSK